VSANDVKKNCFELMPTEMRQKMMMLPRRQTQLCIFVMFGFTNLLHVLLLEWTLKMCLLTQNMTIWTYLSFEAVG